jgi:hypothetical protein
MLTQVLVALVLATGFGVSTVSAQELPPVIPHQVTRMPENARFAILQSQITGKGTYLLDGYLGKVWEAASSSQSGPMIWQDLEVKHQDLDTRQEDNRVNYVLFSSGIAVKFTFLVNTRTGASWQLQESGGVRVFEIMPIFPHPLDVGASAKQADSSVVKPIDQLGDLEVKLAQNPVIEQPKSLNPPVFVEKTTSNDVGGATVWIQTVVPGLVGIIGVIVGCILTSRLTHKFQAKLLQQQLEAEAKGHQELLDTLRAGGAEAKNQAETIGAGLAMLVGNTIPRTQIQVREPPPRG